MENELEKEFVKPEQAKALFELGYDRPCILTYFHIYGHFSNNGDAPLKSEVFRWFREKYKLHSTITSISQESWQWHITKPSESLGKLYDEDFYTYEEAESACIDKLIELAKQQK